MRRQACPPDQRLLLPARRGPARVRRPARGDPRPGEAAVDRAARDQRGPADLRAHRGLVPGRDRRLTVASPVSSSGVSGGIAAYKACELLRLLTESGHDVRVVPDRDGAALRRRADLGGAVRQPGRRPTSGTTSTRCPHVRIGQRRRPGRRRTGHRRPARQGRPRPRRRPAHQHPAHRALPGRVRPGDAHRDVGAPRHPGQRRDAARARRRRHRARRRAASPAPTPGRAGCPTPTRSSRSAARVLRRGAPTPTWPGRHVVVSAGGTREPIDPVRFLGNRSSGLQGYALARTALARGAEVTLVAANVALPDPAGADVVRVGVGRWSCATRCSTRPGATPTPSSWPPPSPTSGPPATASRRSRRPTAEPDADPAGEEPRHPRRAGRAPPAGARAVPQVIVGFAAETDDVLANGRAKLARKGCDLLVVNEVGERPGLRHPGQRGRGPGRRRRAGGDPARSQGALADVVWDLVAARLL